MKRNFTLLELAVVVTVSTLLLTVLVSSAHAAVEQAKKASCQDVLRKIGGAIQLYAKDNANFVLVGVDREETRETVEEYTAKIGTTYPMLLDEKGDVFASYALRKSGITRNVLIDRDGRIVKLTRRFEEAEFNDLVATIDSLLAIQ